MELHYLDVEQALVSLPKIVGVHGVLKPNNYTNGRATKSTAYYEVRDVLVHIESFDDLEKAIKNHGYSLEFLKADLEDRLSKEPVNPGKAIEHDDGGYLKPYLVDGKLEYTYSERLCDQYDKVENLLRKDRFTRRACMILWDKEKDLSEDVSYRVPCSLGYQFHVTGNSLNMTYLMRSLEVEKCVGNDLYTSRKMQEHIAKEAGLEPGSYTLYISSMHRYIEL